VDSVQSERGGVYGVHFCPILHKVDDLAQYMTDEHITLFEKIQAEVLAIRDKAQ